jgi:hypothetical protein
MGLTDVLREAAQHFERGDEQAFGACFHPGVTVYGEPELAGPPLAESREQWTAVARRWREAHPDSTVALELAEEYGEGVVVDAIVMGPRHGGSWRVAVAVRFEDQMVSEIRPFWHRDAALESLTASA